MNACPILLTLSKLMDVLTDYISLCIENASAVNLEPSLVLWSIYFIYFGYVWISVTIGIYYNFGFDCMEETPYSFL